jgi:hypothetical protein
LIDGNRDTLRAMRTPLRALIPLALATACSGGGGDDPVIDAAIDAASAIDATDATVDAPPGACAKWTLSPQPARTIELYDEPLPINGARTFRVAIRYDATSTDLTAMPTITREPGTITIGVNSFGSDQPGGVTEMRRLIVPLLLPAGNGRIVARAPAPAPAISVTVRPAPARPCGVVGACAMDCDCNQARGERCLSATGLVGGFTQCARPCEVDRDCGGRGRCESVDDGLSEVCSTQPECDVTTPCPVGFGCQAGACQPTFVLNQASRGPCACDGDCASGLRCVGGSLAAPGRCQAVCPTGGPWCQGPHFCGTANQDVSGLATTVSVCGWIGE